MKLSLFKCMHVAIVAACSGSPPQCSTFSSYQLMFWYQEISMFLILFCSVGTGWNILSFFFALLIASYKSQVPHIGLSFFVLSVAYYSIIHCVSSHALPLWNVNSEVVQAGPVWYFSYVSSVKGRKGVERP